MNLRDVIKEAEEKKVAIGHFNISNVEALWAIFRAAKNLDVPVIIGSTEGERDFMGVKQTMALVKSVRDEFDYPIFLNADHTHTFERVKEVIDAGYDAVIYDGVNLSLEENIAETKKCVEYARNSGRDVLIEAEMGYIGSSSKMLDELPEGAVVGEDALVKPEDAKRFVEETGVDLLAPAVGNIHGMLKSMPNPEINSERVRLIREAAGVPLVLHGGSGIKDQNFKDAIEAGISTIHINTEIRVAYCNAALKHLTEHPEDIAPYKVMKPSVDAMQEVIDRRLRLFSRMD